MLDAYIAATNSGERSGSGGAKQQDVMVEQRGSELTLGHVIAQVRVSVNAQACVHALCSHVCVRSCLRE